MLLERRERNVFREKKERSENGGNEIEKPVLCFYKPLNRTGSFNSLCTIPVFFLSR